MDSVGLSAELGLLGPSLVIGERAPRREHDEVLTQLAPPVPPALVIDTLGPRGCTYRIEDGFETPVVGIGIDWPHSATLYGGAGSRRLPLPLLIARSSESPMGTAGDHWSVGSGRQQLHVDSVPHEVAVGHYLAQCAERLAAHRPTYQRMVFPVPNAMSLRAMTAILKSAGNRARLIWRPVAALISAIDHSTETFEPLSEDDHVLVLYMGVDGYEATLLHVICRSGDCGPVLRVPGRPRVTRQVNVQSCMAGVLQWMSNRGVKALGRDVSQAWARSWGCKIEMTDGGLKAADWMDGPWDPARQVSGSGGWAWFANAVQRDDCDRECQRAVSAFAESVASLMRSTRALKAIVLAGSQSGADSAVVASILRQAPRGISVVRQPWAVQEGAAIFGWREVKRWATYSDHLPQLDLCVERAGVPTWMSVVDSSWIDAGTPYRNEQGGFRLAKPPVGKLDRVVDLAVTMEGDPHVRETKDLVRFPSGAAREDVPLTIQIEVQAATGEPRVTAIPEGDIAPVVLDWALATSTQMTPEEYLESIPRSFPPNEAIRAAPWWHQPFKYKTVSANGRTYTPKQYVELEVLSRPWTGRLPPESLKVVRTHVIRRSWNKDDRVWEALTSSDGKVQLYQPVMDELQDRLFRWLLTHPSPRDQDTRKKWRDVVKILAWTSFKNDTFEGLVADGLGRQADWIHAIGHALRSPACAATAIRYLSGQLQTRIELASPSTPIKGINNPLKQLAWLLALRNGITAATPSDVMADIADQAFQCACRLKEHDNLNIMFRWSMRCLVLCLVHRQHDSEFLDPSSNLAKRMLHFCRELYLAVGPDDEFAEEIVEEGVARPLQPSIPRPQVARDVKTFIEYLNRRGRGSIIVDDDDGTDEE
jgi:hypothetical protein